VRGPYVGPSLAARVCVPLSHGAQLSDRILARVGSLSRGPRNSVSWRAPWPACHCWRAILVRSFFFPRLWIHRVACAQKIGSCRQCFRVVPLDAEASPRSRAASANLSLTDCAHLGLLRPHMDRLNDLAPTIKPWCPTPLPPSFQFQATIVAVPSLEFGHGVVVQWRVTIESCVVERELGLHLVPK
jgi:hypothetical protein